MLNGLIFYKDINVCVRLSILYPQGLRCALPADPERLYITGLSFYV